MLRRVVDGALPAPSSWPVVRLADVVAGLENGWSPQCLDRPALPGEWGVLKVSAVSSGTYRESENKALPATLAAQPRLKVQTGDILITRANGVARLVGVATAVGATRDLLMICDKIFRVVGLDTSRATADFIVAALSLESARRHIEKEFTTESGMMENVSKPVLLSLTFPLPPLSEQTAMTRELTEGRSAGGRAYGYRPVPGRLGELVIHAEEAAIVRRVFEDYVGGRSSREIAGRLNDEGISPPRGTHWNASTINGQPERGCGILLNPVYGGVIVWNRVSMVRNPDTGKRVSG